LWLSILRSLALCPYTTLFRSHIAWVFDTAISPDVFAVAGGCLSTFMYGRKLWAPHSRHHPGGAHCSGTNTYFQNIGSSFDQIMGSIGRNNIAGQIGSASCREA